jgi:hypothetical protein
MPTLSACAAARQARKNLTQIRSRCTQMHADDFVLLTGQWPHTPVLEIIGAPLLLFGKRCGGDVLRIAC